MAFSGGPDSTALLLGLSELRRKRGIELRAAHVDHGLDPRSGGRAEAARRTCDRLDVPLRIVRTTVPAALVRRRGIEAAAREVRYQELERLRDAAGAAFVVTAHQRDDQVETVLLRLLHGSGWEGLGGIPSRNGRVLRPLLELGRGELRAAVDAAGLEVAIDPANRDPRLARSRTRHSLLPYLESLYPELRTSCLRLATASAAARSRVEARLTQLLDPLVDPRLGAHGASVDRAALERLPTGLLPAAAALLHRTAGADYPPPLAAVAELGRQLARGGKVGGDAGDGWRWESVRENGESRLRLARRRPSVGRFTYTLDVPGAVDLAEISLRLRVRRAPVATWMFRGSPTRTGLGPALRSGERVEVRNRRPGDRMRPLGSPYSRRLKEILIDRRVPRDERSRLPLLCVGGKIAWVPGVAIDEAFRLGEEETAWVAELEPA